MCPAIRSAVVVSVADEVEVVLVLTGFSVVSSSESSSSVMVVVAGGGDDRNLVSLESDTVPTPKLPLANTSDRKEVTLEGLVLGNGVSGDGKDVCILIRRSIIDANESKRELTLS